MESCAKTSDDPQSSAPASTSAAAIPCDHPSLHATYTSATCTALHLFAITSPPPAPTHMPSSLAEPHNYFLGETYCLPAPLSLITMEQKQALTGGTRHAALMSAPSSFFLYFFPANGRILTCQPLFLTAQRNFLSGRDRM